MHIQCTYSSVKNKICLLLLQLRGSILVISIRVRHFVHLSILTDIVMMLCSVFTDILIHCEDQFLALGNFGFVVTSHHVSIVMRVLNINH